MMHRGRENGSLGQSLRVKRCKSGINAGVLVLHSRDSLSSKRRRGETGKVGTDGREQEDEKLGAC